MELLTLKQVAKMVGHSEQYTGTLIRKYKIKRVRVNARLFLYEQAEAARLKKLCKQARTQGKKS